MGAIRFRGRVSVVFCASALLVATLAPPAAGAALPLETHECGDDITTSFRLDNDLLNCDGDGLEVGAPNIVIDLNGHLVESDGLSAVGEYGIDSADGNDGITILNGTIRKFYQGIVFGGQDSQIENVTVAASVENGMDLTGSGHVITASAAIGNGNFGISLLDTPSNVRITKSTLANNAFQGLNVEASADVTVTGNNISGNDDSGITMAGADGYVVEKNTIAGNGNFGIFMNETQPGTKVGKNVVSGNDNTGIFIVDGTGVDISKNTLIGNGYAAQTSNGVGAAIDSSSDPTTGKKNGVMGSDNLAAQCGPAAICFVIG